jgi:Zn-dependent M16 (insulinase) family peptidase
MSTTHGFELLRTEWIPELKAQAQLLRHVKTGAQLLSIENDDENKVFGVSFRTPPVDSTGIAHILEHSVLGGSQKYPLKEPFVQLLKGSLNTFLNAFTSPDHTTYPVASTNLQDFYNLVDVYLDAVFHPLLTPHHLDQEGWHYELEKPEEPLAYKGVVFNEMKGVYSSPDSLLYRSTQQALFPDTTYGVDSGGDPRAIPNLTYAAFKNFHATYYHPSNAQIFFYGDDNPTERLRLLDAVLSGFEPIAVDGEVALQEPFGAPRWVTESYSADANTDNSKKSMVMVNWALPEITDRSLLMAISVLSYCLMSTQASPLRKALVDSGLGEDVIGGGFGAGLRQMTFGAGLKGIKADDAPQVEELVLATLQKLAAEGFDPEMVEAAINTIEFSLRENNTGGAPRGLGLFMRVLRSWTYGRDPIEALGYELPLGVVKQRLATDPALFGQLIETYLLGNRHRLTVLLTPDTERSARLEAEEKTRLVDAKAAMSPEQIAQIIENTRLLKARQDAPDSPEDLARLPMLKLSDLEQENRPIPRQVIEREGGAFPKIVYSDLFTNGIVYLRVGFDLRSLPQELLPYAEFFGRSLLEMGTEQEDYVKLTQRIGRKTGGIAYSTHVSPVLNDPEGTSWLFLHGKAMAAQGPELLAIMLDILQGVKLDNPQRFKQIVLKVKARMESSLIPGGHQYVGGRLRAAFSTAEWVEEQLDGIEALFFVRRLAEEVENNWPHVLAQLEAVKRLLVDRSRAIASVTLDGDNFAEFRPQLDAFFNALPLGEAPPAQWTPTSLPPREGLTMPAQVNYVGKGARLYDLGYTYDGSIHVITNFIRTGFLWDQVRARGGAYGAFCGFSKQSGVLTFLSYRDPNLLGTLASYDATAQFLRTVPLDESELTKNIIGAIRNIDPYQLPDAKGWSSFLRYLVGETDATRQQMREQVLSTTAEDFRQFADVLSAATEQARIVVLGSGPAIESANQELDPPLQVTPLT